MRVIAGGWHVGTQGRDVNCDTGDVFCTTPMYSGVLKPQAIGFVSRARPAMSALQWKRSLGAVEPRPG